MAGRRWSWAWAVAAALAALELVAALQAPYGWFIDELYYRACALRLAWGFVDHPPMSVGVLALSRALFGDALLALRVWPALAVAGAALAASALARRFGGGEWARCLAALCVAASPVVQVMGSYFSMNAFELLLWPLGALALLDAVERGGRRWLPFGALLGLALLNKHTSLAWALALLASLALSPARRQLATPWPWLAALLAALLVAPNLAWQLREGWPSLEFYQQAQRVKNIPTPPLGVLAGQVLAVGPAAAPLVVLGVARLIRRAARPAERVLGGGFLLLLALMVFAQSSRPDRLAAYQPILFAAGAVALEALGGAGRRWLVPLSIGVVLCGGAVFLPVALPLFSPMRVAAHAAALGVVPQLERGRQSALPQWLADRLRWPELVEAVARAYRGLSREERARALIFAPTYGEAGALELWGPALGLPRVLSNHNSYHLWASHELEREDAQALQGAVWICVGSSREALARWFERVERLDTVHCDGCIDWRRDRALWLASSPRLPLREFWPELRKFE